LGPGPRERTSGAGPSSQAGCSRLSSGPEKQVQHSPAVLPDRRRSTVPWPERSVLLVGVRGHGGEEVYCRLLCDHPPDGVRYSATLGFHASCSGARCLSGRERILNRLVHPWAAPDQGFRVLSLDDSFDLVHIHTHPTVLNGLKERPVVFSAGSSHYHYLRDYEGWSEARIRRRYNRARTVFPALGVIDSLLTHSRVTIAYTFSEYGRAPYLAWGVPRSKIRVLYPGFDIPHPRPASADRDVRFLFLGRNPRRKGGDLVLEAFQELRRACPAARLVYATDDPPESPIGGVDAIPLVPHEHVGALFGSCDVFVSPTRAEGFGFTNVEAQGFGLPVISTRVGAIPEVVEHGKTGVLVEPGDATGLLVAMRQLAEDPSLIQEMAVAARERFEERFSLSVFQRGLRAIYEEALDRSVSG